MSIDPATQRYTRIRGLILKALITEHPAFVDKHVLRLLLDDMGYPTTEEEFESHLVYLEDTTKAYIESEERKGKGFHISLLRITPTGMDLMDKLSSESDPGVSVDF